MSLPQGIIPPMLSSFGSNGEVDTNKLKEFVSYLVENGVHGLFPCSTLGEFSSLSPGERKKVIGTVTEEADKQVPVLPGTGSASIKVTAELSIYAQSSGADGVIIVVPFYFTSTQAGLKEYYGKIAESISIPLIIYNFPQNTGFNISVDTVVKLEKRYENIRGIKDSSGNFDRLMRLRRKVSDDFKIYQGIDSLLLPSLRLGCSGGMVGSANIVPETVIELFDKFQEEDWASCEAIQLEKINPLVEGCQEYGIYPSGCKAALKAKGLDLGPLRPPLQGLSSEDRSFLKGLLNELGLNKSIDLEI